MNNYLKIENLNGFLVHRLQKDMSLEVKDLVNDNRLKKITFVKDYYILVRIKLF